MFSLPSISLNTMLKLSMMVKGIRRSVALAKSAESEGGEKVTPAEIINIVMGNMIPVADVFGLEDHKDSIRAVVNKGNNISDIVFGEVLNTERELAESSDEKSPVGNVFSALSFLN